MFGRCITNEERLLSWLQIDRGGQSDIMVATKILKLSKHCKDITGQKFGRLVAIEPIKKSNNSNIVWLCQCKCGNICEIRGDSLRGGDTESCGCLNRERHTKHGMYGTPVYKILQNILQRCENPKNSAYKYYGGRGIKVCKRWHTFENFYEDVGDPPEGTTFDRWPDNDGDYEPSNWRWATRKEQMDNTRKLYWFCAWHKNSAVQHLSNNQCEFSRKYNLNQSCVCACLQGKQHTHKGWQFKKINSRLSF